MEAWWFCCFSVVAKRYYHKISVRKNRPPPITIQLTAEAGTVAITSCELVIAMPPGFDRKRIRFEVDFSVYKLLHVMLILGCYSVVI